MNDAVQVAATRALAAVSGSGPSIPVVVSTGLVLVFFILILLTLVLIGEGRLFAWLEAKRKPAGPKAAQPALKAAPRAGAAAQAAGAPKVQQGIPPEVVAAIAGAVNQLEDGKYTMLSVRRQNAQGPRNNWGLAGVMAATEPF